jgi:DnaJ family protein C protein 2
MFTFSAPSSSSRTHAISKSGITLGEAMGALPFGRAALLRLGGVIALDDAVAAGKQAFDMSLIKIPEGVTPKNLKQYTFYNLLGFEGELGDSADVEVIKKAYHKAVLMYHPDKAQFKDSNGKEDRSVFLKIQEAFKVLCSEPLRRAYDSQLPFDDAIPTEEITEKFMAKGDHKFYKLFGPIFKRNARWSVKKPVPELGDENTSINDVMEFYSFWNKFDSWRDFTGAGSDNKPEDAGSREERRHMEKENEKLAVKMKKKEMNRIIDLVTLAERKDPRILAAKNARKEAKEASLRSREAAAASESQNEASALAWIEAEEKALRDANAANKAEREKLKKKASEQRNLLKKLLRAAAALGHGSKGEYGPFSNEELETIASSAELDDLREINIALGDKEAEKDNSLFKPAGLEVVTAKLAKFAQVAADLLDDERITREARKREAEDKAFKSPQKDKKTREWSSEDDDAVRSGLARYAVGHATRWQSICNFLNDKRKPTLSFTVKDTQIRAWQLSTQQA